MGQGKGEQFLGREYGYARKKGERRLRTVDRSSLRLCGMLPYEAYMIVWSSDSAGQELEEDDSHEGMITQAQAGYRSHKLKINQKGGIHL